MSTIEFVQDSMKNLHGAFTDAVADITDEQAHWRPGGLANHIAFILWHYLRTEDNIFLWVLQRKPTVWIEGGWDAKYNLDSKSQGTGMPSEDAAALRLDPWAEFPTYMSTVFREAEAYLATLSDSDLSENVMVKPFGESPLIDVIDRTVMNHGYSHLGELWVLKGLQGMKGSPI